MNKKLNEEHGISHIGKNAEGYAEYVDNHCGASQEERMRIQEAEENGTLYKSEPVPKRR